MELATTCASSASFPPLFGPLQLGYELKKRDTSELSEQHLKNLSKVALSDGGLYDNLGKNLIAGAPDYLVRLFSDAGSPYTPTTSWTKDARVLLKYMQLMSTFIGRLNYQMIKLIKKNDFAFWSAQYPQENSGQNSFGYNLSLIHI